MVKQHNKALRPLAIAILLAGAFGAQAADREVFKGNNSAASAGLKASDMKAERSMTYANGLKVTRHQQMY